MGDLSIMGLKGPDENWEERENRDWEAMPFVRCSNGAVVTHWSPADTDDYFVARRHGVQYAVRMVRHLQYYQGRYGVDVARRLSDVVREIGDRGLWTGAELSFVQSLGDYIGSFMITEDEGFAPLCQVDRPDTLH